jgi:hypothetical protein
MEPSLGTQDDPGATHEIALVAELAQQGRVSVWKRPLLSASMRTHSCRTLHQAQPLVSHG